MHWIADLMAAIGVVLNGIPQGIMAMMLGFAVFPTTFSFVFASAVNGIFGSVAPLSFQAESLALVGNLGKDLRERTSIIFGGSLIMVLIGLTGSLTRIVDWLGSDIMNAMMAGVAHYARQDRHQHDQSRTKNWLAIDHYCRHHLFDHQRSSLDHRLVCWRRKLVCGIH